MLQTRFEGKICRQYCEVRCTYVSVDVTAYMLIYNHTSGTCMYGVCVRRSCLVQNLVEDVCTGSRCSVVDLMCGILYVVKDRISRQT